MSTIESGDLIRFKAATQLAVYQGAAVAGDYAVLVAKGPGWTRHDGSAVNPVPGARCEVLSGPTLCSKKPSEDWNWPAVKFYRVTTPAPSQPDDIAEMVKGILADAPSQPPAPQPGWVATVTLELVENADEHGAQVLLPSGEVLDITEFSFAAIDWSPPPPPPWEPEIGQTACIGLQPFIVRGLYNGLAWVEDLDGDMLEERVSDLSPPKGGA